MQCPKCKASMEKVVFEGVEVDRCMGCWGIWFDFQEQKQLKQMKGAAT
jgi:Zn-finger nucleic acid-binding protein